MIDTLLSVLGGVLGGVLGNYALATYARRIRKRDTAPEKLGVIPEEGVQYTVRHTHNGHLQVIYAGPDGGAARRAYKSELVMSPGNRGTHAREFYRDDQLIDGWMRNI